MKGYFLVGYFWFSFSLFAQTTEIELIKNQRDASNVASMRLAKVAYYGTEIIRILSRI